MDEASATPPKPPPRPLPGAADATESQYRLLAEAIPQIVWTATPDGAHDYYNERWYRYTGLTPEQSHGSGWQPVIHPEDLPACVERWRCAVATGGVYEVEHRFRRAADGAFRWHLARALPLRDQQGRILKWFGTSTDIHDQKEALVRIEEERRLVETLNRIGGRLAAELDLQRLLQLVTDEATALTGAQFGAFFYNAVNEAGESYTLYTLSGAPREAFARFPPPRNTAIFGPTFRGEAIVRLDDVTRDPRYGKNAPYRGMPPGHLPVRSYLAVPVVSRSGEVLGGLFFGHPTPGVFTERHERLLSAVAVQAGVAIDNARLYQSAQDAVRMRDNFLSVASHELNTPLTPLQLQLQVILRDAERGETPPGSLVPKLRMMERQIKRMGEFIDTLLDVSRAAAGRMELQPQEVCLAALAREVGARFVPEAERAGSSLTVRAPESMVGWWDPMRLEQVVMNLVSNAVKYGAGKPIEVEVSGALDSATLVVRDGGIGIAPEDQERVFERFERVAPGRSYAGFGLGLWIVRKIVELCAGTVSVASEPGRGATFTVVLPRRRARPARASA